jgi:hypothetical protein
MTELRALCFAVVLGCVFQSAHGQSVIGRVSDASTRGGVATALVVVVDSAGREYARTLADSAGVFRLVRLPTKPRLLRVERFGYAPFQAELHLEKNELLRVDVPLSPAGVPAAPLEVTARRVIRDPRLAEFYQRMDFQERAGFGRFLHREQIDSVSLPVLTDYIARFTRVSVDGAGDRAFIPGRGNCGKVQLFVDGLKTDQPINAVPVAAVEGVELYRSRSELPMEYSYGQAVDCGALLVWTRSGPSQGKVRFAGKVFIIALAVGLSLVPIMDLR